MLIRKGVRADEDRLTAMRCALWPKESETEHRADARALLDGTPQSTLPVLVFVAEGEGGLVGFVEVGLRSHADGCDPCRPCDFIEGWYVEPASKRRGIGQALLERAEVWCREQGCTELASDTWLDNEESERAHAALGFEVVDRCVNYRKALTRV